MFSKQQLSNPENNSQRQIPPADSPQPDQRGCHFLIKTREPGEHFVISTPASRQRRVQCVARCALADAARFLYKCVCTLQSEWVTIANCITDLTNSNRTSFFDWYLAFRKKILHLWNNGHCQSLLLAREINYLPSFVDKSLSLKSAFHCHLNKGYPPVMYSR